MRIDTGRLKQYLIEKLVENIQDGMDDFERFADEIEAYLNRVRQSSNE